MLSIISCIPCITTNYVHCCEKQHVFITENSELNNKKMDTSSLKLKLKSGKSSTQLKVVKGVMTTGDDAEDQVKWLSITIKPVHCCEKQKITNRIYCVK